MRRHRTLLLIAAVLVAALPSHPRRVGAQSPPADTVLLNGTIITVDPTDSIAEALDIRGGRIVLVGPTDAGRK